MHSWAARLVCDAHGAVLEHQLDDLLPGASACCGVKRRAALLRNSADVRSVATVQSKAHHAMCSAYLGRRFWVIRLLI